MRSSFLGKSSFAIFCVDGVSQGLASLVVDKSPSSDVIPCFNKILSTNISETFCTPTKYVHWSSYGIKFSSTKTLFPSFRALPCRGNATKFPKPPSGNLS